jgi:type II secretory ATPase GspE/PulE/Tfp pilus assembly ATPase PilB-like protein
MDNMTEWIVTNCKKCRGHGCPTCDWSGKVARSVSREVADVIYEERRLAREAERLPSIADLLGEE